MSDNSFDSKPMVTVVSDSLDPRVKRQLQSQLQSDLVTVDELNAEISAQNTAKEVKQQTDAAGDASEFDDDETKDKKDPQAIENDPDNKPKPEGNAENDNASQTDTSQGSNTDSGDGSNPNISNTNTSDGNNNQDGSVQNQPQTQGNNDAGGESQNNDNQPQSTEQKQTDTNNQSNNGGQNNGDQNVDQNSGTDGSTNDNSGGTNTPSSNSGTENGNTQSTSQDGDGGDDPFTSDNINFEDFAPAFAHERGYKSKPKMESEAQTSESKLPPLKVIVYVKATDRGVDDRTSAVIASIEDPENTVVILDQSGVAEASAKMEFKSLMRQLQSRNVMVVDSVDAAVEYLNNVYDQLSGQ